MFNPNKMNAFNNILSFFKVETSDQIGQTEEFKAMTVRTKQDIKEGRKVLGYFVDFKEQRLMIVEKFGVLTYGFPESSHMELEKHTVLHTNF